jgi:hypothetical protein
MFSLKERPKHLVLLFLLLAGVCQLSCKQRARGVGLLPRQTPPDAIKYSEYKPEKPFTQIAPGVLSRKAYSADDNSLYHIELQDLLIAPGQKSGSLQLSGAAVFEVREEPGC